MRVLLRLQPLTTTAYPLRVLPAKPNFKFKINTAGGSPAASHFFLLRQRKSNQKEGDPGLPPTSWVPCVARQVRLPHKLARSATRPRAQTYSSEFPDQPPLLGGAQGMKKRKPKILKS